MGNGLGNTAEGRGSMDYRVRDEGHCMRDEAIKHWKYWLVEQDEGSKELLWDDFGSETL